MLGLRKLTEAQGTMLSYLPARPAEKTCSQVETNGDDAGNLNMKTHTQTRGWKRERVSKLASRHKIKMYEKNHKSLGGDADFDISPIRGFR